MVDNKTIKSKVEDAKEKYEETKETRKEKYEETKEKSKNFADNVMNDLYKSIDEIKENIKTVQKAADEKYTSYKQATVLGENRTRQRWEWSAKSGPSWPRRPLSQIGRASCRERV